MIRRSVLCRVLSGTIWILSTVSGFVLSAEPKFNRQISGRFSIESQWYPESAAHPDQRGHATGFVMEPELYLDSMESWSFTFAPFFRYDSADTRRTHADLKEAYLLLFGYVGNDEWELRLGIDRAFWGVAESRHLVNIVNQIDLVEHPYKELKLGQPMARLTWSGNWGMAEIFGLPYHRPRTFPGRTGRLRLPLVVDNDQVSYESAAGQWHLDLAARYSHIFGPFDIGISAFDGTSREPFLLPSTDFLGAPTLAPHYEQIRQFGLDTQLTAGSWLFKLEAIQRLDARDRLGRKVDYSASVIGGEYTFYSALGSNVDISLLGEWNSDGRGQYATNVFQKDLFVAARFALNDVRSTEILASILGDADSTSRVLAFELNRRLSDQWSLNMEAIAFLDIDQADISYEIRRDSFIDLNLIYNF
ncbi:MAG: hypothetical protein F7B06_05510 [Opitutae bacterium]|nr:hypothetical protein [Opitutae bacterium]MBC9889301.1 hypothetical protein [Opitutae bacterium]